MGGEEIRRIGVMEEGSERGRRDEERGGGKGVKTEREKDKEGGRGGD